MVINRAYGFHSAKAALALIMLTLGPIEHVLPHEPAAIPATDDPHPCRELQSKVKLNGIASSPSRIRSGWEQTVLAS